MTNCPKCNNHNLQKRGTRTLSTGEIVGRFFCRVCNTQFTDNKQIGETSPSVVEEFVDNIIKDRILLDGRVVITSVKNGSKTDKDFLGVLKKYVSIKNCSLLAIPVRHRNVGENTDPDFDPEIIPYLCHENIHFENHGLKIMGSLKIFSAIENPLSGLDPISKGASLIVGHPQVQLKTLPRVRETYPAIVTTTGSVSVKNYNLSKPGTKADFNHSLSAVVVEFDDGFVHIRHLNFDEDSKTFSDLDETYSIRGKTKSTIEAIVTGDEHVLHKDETVAAVTYTNPDSLVNILKPKNIIRHDVFDAYSISHHHEKNVFLKYKKYIDGTCSVEDELNITLNFINDTTPSYATTWLIQSNHNEHLTRWLNECDPKIEPWNAKVYHKLMYEMLCSVETDGVVDAFQLYAKGLLNKNVLFADRDSDLYVKDILLSMHGDAGTNGARGSIKQFSMLPTKTIVGHSHTCAIEKGAMQVGTSSKLKMEYNKGASSWHHGHAIIHTNGKRQLIFITHGKYRV